MATPGGKIPSNALVQLTTIFVTLAENCARSKPPRVLKSEELEREEEAAQMAKRAPRLAELREAVERLRSEAKTPLRQLESPKELAARLALELHDSLLNVIQMGELPIKGKIAKRPEKGFGAILKKQVGAMLRAGPVRRLKLWEKLKRDAIAGKAAAAEIVEFIRREADARWQGESVAFDEWLEAGLIGADGLINPLENSPCWWNEKEYGHFKPLPSVSRKGRPGGRGEDELMIALARAYILITGRKPARINRPPDTGHGPQTKRQGDFNTLAMDVERVFGMVHFATDERIKRICAMRWTNAGWTVLGNKGD